MTHGSSQTTGRHASGAFEEKSGALKVQRRKKNLISVPLHFSLSFHPCLLLLLPSFNPPLFLIFLRTEVPACLAHDIDFHQCLEIAWEQLPGQRASTFLHFCILPEFFFSPVSFFIDSAHRPTRWQMLSGKEAMVWDGEEEGGWLRRRREQQSGRWLARRKGAGGGEQRDGLLCQVGAGRAVDTLARSTVCVYVWCGGGLLMSPQWELAGPRGGGNKTPEHWHQWTRAC